MNLSPLKDPSESSPLEFEPLPKVGVDIEFWIDGMLDSGDGLVGVFKNGLFYTEMNRRTFHRSKVKHWAYLTEAHINRV